MSWAEEDWTVGLSGRVLQKVKELQVHHERLSRENKQKQLQLDNIHASLEKQTVKYEEVRGELQFVQRDLQSVREEAKAAVVSRERLTQDLHTRQAQVCSLEGQLDAARTINNKLTQEIKRLEAELEKLQNSSRSADTTLFSTPCWNASSPREQNAESKRDAGWSGNGDKARGQSRIRQRLQFSDTPANPHRSTAHHHSLDQSESYSTPSAAFPWERDDTRRAARRPSPSSPQTPCADVVSQGQSAPKHCGKETEHRDMQTDASLSEMQSRVSRLEEELSVKARAMQSVQSDAAQSRKELAARELSLQKARDELSLAHTRISQEGQRASGAEQKLKHMQEELRCQRQNAESSRLQQQQRMKELEKQHQMDVAELQKERQWLEKQHQQEVNKLNQELQQARTLHNALQAQADKLSLQKQALDKELETLKEKLKWTEGQLKDSQKKEAQTQAKLTESLREAESVSVSLEQSRKRERGLEEEGRRLSEERADALRLLKDLQEQTAAAAASPPPALQPAQFSPGQTFSSPPSYAPHTRSSAHIKRPAAPVRAEHKKEEHDAFEGKPMLSAPYPPDREPGEGIDSEDISSTDSESLAREGHRGKSNEEKNRTLLDLMECDRSSVVPGLSPNTSVDVYHCSMSLSDEKTPAPLEQTKATEDLKRENAALRSEIKDVREELQKRLEDLETQRRAEAEARTRLKQLSRKRASQAVDKEEQEKEWKTKLDSERTEVERLKKAMAGLEAEVRSRKQEMEKKSAEGEGERSKALEDRESEMTELNIQLKKQLAEVKAQLVLEREERKLEEEERNQTVDEKKELNTKVAELQAELEELKLGKKEDTRGAEEKLLLANSPLTYLTLHDDKLNSNVVHREDNLLLSPEQHLLFCQSTNQINTMVSRGTAELIHEKQTATHQEFSPHSNEAGTGQETFSLDNLGAASPSDAPPEEREAAPLHLVKEVVRLKREKLKETERADQIQLKLEALQSQVTRQTQQLTMAFEKQSQHISGLLGELRDKEMVLLSQEEEMQRWKQEVEALKAEKDVKRPNDSFQTKAGQDMEREMQQEVDCAAQRSEGESKSDPRTLSPVSSEGDGDTLLSEGQGPDSEDSYKTDSNQDSACVMEEPERHQGGAELLALRRENQLLRRRLQMSTFSDARETDEKNAGDAVASCPTERQPFSLRSDIITEGQESPPQNQGDDLKREEKRTMRAEEREEDSPHHLHRKHLELQVVALQEKVRALSVETQQQREELSRWRLASQPAATFELLIPQKDDQDSQIDESQSSAVTGQMPRVQENSTHVTIIREDQLLLSSFSNKLQGRMLFSRLQHSNLPEPKSFHQSKRTAVLQEHNQDGADIDQESEKENVQWSDIGPIQPEVNSAAVLIHTESEKTDRNVTKASSTTKTSESHRENPVDKLSTPGGSSKGFIRTGTKSVSSQTETSSRHRAPSLRSAHTQTEEGEEVDSAGSPPPPPVSAVPSSSEWPKSGDKVFSGSFPIPADPARLAERIRHNRTQLSAAFDDTEYEPYGLPEVVMKGFADIPTGPSCPYIVRRGLLGTSVVPVVQKVPGNEEEETD